MATVRLCFLKCHKGEKVDAEPRHVGRHVAGREILNVRLGLLLCQLHALQGHQCIGPNACCSPRHGMPGNPTQLANTAGTHCWQTAGMHKLASIVKWTTQRALV